MKRSKSIRLVLIGGLAAGGLSSCDSGPQSARLEPVYTNNYYVPGRGYYHAPFRDWYPMPYNHQDPQTGQYFQGGQWAAAPHESITNISAALQAQNPPGQTSRTGVTRSGFGSSSHSSFISS